MTVGVAQGDPVEFILPTQAIGSASKTVALNNITWWFLATISLTWSATATVGTRFPRLRFQDAAGNGICDLAGAAGLTAGSQFKFTGGPLQQEFAANATLGMATCYPVAIPPGSQLLVQDTGAIDPNDTVQVTAVFTQ